MKSFLVDQDGYYGEFGGAYVPEILHKCVEELKNTYLGVLESEDFKKEFDQLLRDYVGRPSPLYLARRLSMEKEGRDHPDYLIACVGGGSNAAGTIYHYINDERVGIILAEAGGKGIETGMTAATIQLGKMGIIHGARTYVIQNEDGQIEEPYSISAGLDYPGIGPIHANLAAQRRATVLAVNDDEAIEAAYELTKLEGIIPALESAHALGALKKLKFKPEDVVVLTVSGRGDKDIETYLSFNEK